MRILSGLCNLKENRLENQSKNIFSAETEEYHISVFGEVILEGQKNSCDLISSYFKKYGNRITEYSKGLYILVIYDKVQNQLSIFQDRTTSPVTLYYTVQTGVLYYSTSLKHLLLHSGINRKTNESVIESFLLNGFIYGEQTLMEGVYKIKSFHCLHADENGVTQQAVTYNFGQYAKEDAVSNFKSILDKAILKQAEGASEVNAPLSGGYDSSYIVDVLSKQTSLPINAFSVGGKFGKNELPVVEQNIKSFQRAKWFSELTDSSTLQNFPDIVWRLEGSVYEVGLFLQYELNRMVHENGKTAMLCGECADQVLNQYYFDAQRNADGKLEFGKYYEFSDYPFIYGSYVILKKNGILANSFDIRTKYPYLDDEFVALCKPLGEYNGKKKRFHVENCQKCLPGEIIERISKIGGSTECHSLFNSDAEIKRFFRYVEKSDFFRRYRAIIKKHSYAEKVKPTPYIAAKTKLRNMIYFVCKKELDRAGLYFNEEMKLKEYLNILYLILFDELILSGKYDRQFEQNALSDKLNAFIR